jgi:hypothetical protein
VGAKPQEWEDGYNTYVAQKATQNWRAGEKEPHIIQPKEKTWWEKSVDWIDEHQVEIALGIGVVAGVAAVILTAGLALPALAVIAGAAVAAGGTVALGTMGLNAYYERPWNENLVRNILIAEITAAVITGAWFLFQSGTTLATIYCARNTTACARVEPILKVFDIAEEAWLSTKLGFQTWRGNDTGAAETAFELQLEHVDGGMPGNSIAKELGGEALEKGAKYGDEALDLIKLYGDDAINLIKDHGDVAIKVMRAVDPKAAKKLLETLDDDVLDYAIQQGPDAVYALSLWNEKWLADESIAVQLSLRSGQDAKVLKDIKLLLNSGPIDPAKLTKEQQDLINAIAANSTQYADGGQGVLGKWYGFDNGYAGYANDTGSINYYPHPEMWELLGKLRPEKRDEVAWLVNKQAIQPMINKGIPFEYTLNDVPNVENEKDLIEGIWQGTINDAKIMDKLELDYVPGRIKELEALEAAGYELLFDDVQNSYLLIKP